MARKNTSSGDTVTVACKLPQGLHIKLPEHGIDLKLHGAHSPYAIGGHGMTRGVNAAQWATVEAVFGETGMNAMWLKNESVFSMNKEQDASDKATDQKDNRVGFEQIDPRNPNNGLPIGIRIQAEGGDDLGR